MSNTTFSSDARLAWVIKDSKGNFARADSVGKWDKKTWFYMSHKTFCEACRANTIESQAEICIENLRLQGIKMGLDETWHLEHCDLNQLCQDYIDFKNTNPIHGANNIYIEMAVI